jgi:hypothetical protein
MLLVVQVFGTARNVPKGLAVVDEILVSDPFSEEAIHLVQMELDSLDSVKLGPKESLQKTNKINVLVKNCRRDGCIRGSD